MGASRDFLTFSGQTLQPIFTQIGSDDVDSRKDVPFAVKIATFHIFWSRPPNKSKFCKVLDKKFFARFWPLTLEVQRKSTPYSSSESNESDIVNRQSGSEKLKYVLKFCIGYTSHDIAHAQRRFSIVSMSTWCLRQNISETVREGDFGKKDHQ